MHFFGVSWYSLMRRGTRCAQKSMSSYNTCDHLGSSLHGRKSDALVPDRLRVKTGRPVHGRILIHNLNGLLDGVVSGDWYYFVDRAVSDRCCTQRPLTIYIYIYKDIFVFSLYIYIYVMYISMNTYIYRERDCSIACSMCCSVVVGPGGGRRDATSALCDIIVCYDVV